MKKMAASSKKTANYVTEAYLDGKLSVLKRELKEEIVEMREEHKQYKDEVLTKLDGIAGDLGAMREENTIGSHQTSQLREQAEDHEKRIKNLEKFQHTT